MTDIQNSQITLQSRFYPSEEVLIQEVDGEAVLLDLRNEQYYSLNAVGVGLWHSLAQEPSLASAHAELLARYEVDAARLESDLVAIAADLVRAGLVAADPA